MSLFYIVKFYLFKFFGVSVFRTPYGVDFISNYNDATFKYYALGSYGKFYSNYLSNISGHDFIFLDVGANQGLYSILSSHNPCCLSVYSFEPVDASFKYLINNVSISTYSEKITPLKYAIGGDGYADIFIPPNHSGAASLNTSIETLNYSAEKIEFFNIDKLAHLVQGDTRIVIKIDVEGFEFNVLKQLLSSSFSNRISSIFCEINQDWHNFSDIKSLLFSHGFSVTKIGSGSHYDVICERDINL